MAEGRGQRDLDVPANIDPFGDAGRGHCLRERLLLGRATRAGGADECEARGQCGLGLRRGASRDIEDDGRRSLGAAGSHRRTGSFGAGEHSSLTIPHDHRGVGAAAVHPK